MEKIYKIPEEPAGQRIDHYLAMIFPANSRTFYQKLIKEGYVRLNERIVGPNYRLKLDDEIKVNFPEPRQVYCDPDLLDIIYEDKAVLVINKQAGIVVHPSSRNLSALSKQAGKEPTIVDILLSKNRFNSKPGIVHRLDKDTSGVMVIAKTPKAQADLIRQFAERKIKKTYLCIVEGKFNEKKGVIDAQLTRDSANRKKFRIGAGRKAVTKFRILKSLKDDYTLLEVMPVTGRTHQIRVHLASIGHYVLGDKTYCKKGKVSSNYDFIKRQMLHSYKIVLTHPVTKKSAGFTAELPDDFKLALKKLKIKATDDR
jgi:23S rRNA pseudouridine1911/1915/1917 synthase